MDVAGRRVTGNEDVDTGCLCDPCLVDNDHENAQAYCTDCNEFLCDTCSRVHRKSKVSRGHRLLNRDEMPRRKMASLEDQHCPKHANKQIEYHCKIHSQFCCTVCVTLDHVQCGVAYIEDLSTDYNTSKEYQDLLKHIADIESELDRNMSITGTHSEHVNTCYNQMIEEIKAFRHEINSKLDEMENMLLKEAQIIKTDELKNLDSISKSCETIQADMTDMTSMLDNLEKYRQNTQLVIFSKKAQIRVKAYREEMKKISECNHVRNYSFERNEEILASLLSSINLGTLKYKEGGDTMGEKDGRTLKNKEGVDTMGEKDGRTLKNKQGGDTMGKKDGRTLKNKEGEDDTLVRTNGQTLKHKDGVVTLVEKDKQTQARTTKGNEYPRPVKATYLRQVNIQHNQDKKTCDITGSVLLTNDTLALTDNNNNSVKIVDLHSDTVTSFIRLEDTPRDITCMNPGTLIVTSITKLTFLRYDRRLSIIKELPMEEVCRGITYGNNKLFVTFAKQPAVKILDTDGNILQTFKTNSQGQNLFVCPRYITLSNDGQTMYVSDSRQHTVTSLGMDGQVYNIYKHEHLRYPEGITVDGNNSVYVVGGESNNVHQITSQCRHVQIVLERKDVLDYPRTVSYNSNTNTMYIAGGYGVFRACNYMYVYKME